MISALLASEQRRRIWLYFVDLRVRYALVVVFLALILVETSLGKGLLLIGLAWVGGALVLSQRRPPDQELDELFSRDLEAHVEKAVKHLEPREKEMQAAPLALYGPVEQDTPSYYRLFTRPKTGRDNGRRSPVNRVVVLVPMEDHLGIYSCHYDSLRDITSQVSIEEHHYRDVVSVTLEADLEVSDGLQRRQYQTLKGESYLPTQVFSLEFTSGRRLSIPVSVRRRSEGEEASLPTELDKTVHAIRVLLRDKR